MVVEKKCGCCKKILPIEKFGNNKSKKDGKRSQCKICEKEYRDRNKHNKQEYYQANKKNFSDKSKQYYLENRCKILERQKKYQKENKEKIKKYLKENKYKIKMNQKKYKEKNKDKIKQDKNKWLIEKRKNDKYFKLKENIASLFRETLRKQSIKKLNRFFKYTKIHIDEYIVKLKKSKYWNDFCNSGSVHIDHIIPVSAYDFNDPKEIKKCWHPDNLRLLPAKMNMSKFNKIDYNLIKQHRIEHLLPERLKNELQIHN